MNIVSKQADQEEKKEAQKGHSSICHYFRCTCGFIPDLFLFAGSGVGAEAPAVSPGLEALHTRQSSICWSVDG